MLTARSVALMTLGWLTDIVFLVTAEICTPSQNPLAKIKSCPGFKDKEAEEHCCPSAIEPGTFFCCDRARLTELEEERQAAIRRAFLSKYVQTGILFSLDVERRLYFVLCAIAKLWKCLNAMPPT